MMNPMNSRIAEVQSSGFVCMISPSRLEDFEADDHKQGERHQRVRARIPRPRWRREAAKQDQHQQNPVDDREQSHYLLAFLCFLIAFTISALVAWLGTSMPSFAAVSFKSSTVCSFRSACSSLPSSAGSGFACFQKSLPSSPFGCASSGPASGSFGSK